MKDEISNNKEWERYIELLDGDIRPTLKDTALNRKNDIKNIGFDYRGSVLTRTVSGVITGETKRATFIRVLDFLFDYLIDSVKSIKRHSNFAIPKKWRDFN
jgi:hypothetical protein